MNMEKNMFILCSALLTAGHAGWAAGEYLAIRANGATGTVTQRPADTLSVTIEINAGDYIGLPADWWVLADTGGTWYYYDMAVGFTPGMQVSYQGGLQSLAAYQVLNMGNLPPGSCQFYFGVDTIVNGQLDMPALVYDTVRVVVQDADPDPDPDPDPPEPQPGTLLQPTNLTYLGAFRLPPDSALPDQGWEWGGYALAHYPDGDSSGPADGYPGSLYGTGNAGQTWVGEISIPVPVISTVSNLADLNTATLLRGFKDIRAGIPSLEQLYDNRMLLYAGLEYLPAADARPARLYACFGDHFHDPGTPQDTPSHAWTDLDLTNNQGAWWISTQSLYSVNQYIFEIPATWADQQAGAASRILGTGRFREGGWSGMGPALFAIAPWLSGNPPAADAILPATPLLLYSNTRGEDPTSYAMTNYHNADNWFDGAWLNAGDRAAVVFIGLKGLGQTWYGYADGTVVPDDGPAPPIPPFPNDNKTWWSTSFQAQLIFYNPADLAAVGAGSLAPYQPQPYAVLDLDPYLWNIDKVNHPDFNVNQNKYRVGALAFDRASSLLYLVEDRGDAEYDRPLIHVFRVSGE